MQKSIYTKSVRGSDLKGFFSSCMIKIAQCFVILLLFVATLCSSDVELQECEKFQKYVQNMEQSAGWLFSTQNYADEQGRSAREKMYTKENRRLALQKVWSQRFLPENIWTEFDQYFEKFMKKRHQNTWCAPSIVKPVIEKSAQHLPPFMQTLKKFQCLHSLHDFLVLSDVVPYNAQKKDQEECFSSLSSFECLCQSICSEPQEEYIDAWLYICEHADCLNVFCAFMERDKEVSLSALEEGYILIEIPVTKRVKSAYHTTNAFLDNDQKLSRHILDAYTLLVLGQILTIVQPRETIALQPLILRLYDSVLIGIGDYISREEKISSIFHTLVSGDILKVQSRYLALDTVGAAIAGGVDRAVYEQGKDLEEVVHQRLHPRIFSAISSTYFCAEIPYYCGRILFCQEWLEEDKHRPITEELALWHMCRVITTIKGDPKSLQTGKITAYRKTQAKHCFGGILEKITLLPYVVQAPLYVRLPYSDSSASFRNAATFPFFIGKKDSILGLSAPARTRLLHRITDDIEDVLRQNAPSDLNEKTVKQEIQLMREVMQYLKGE